MRKVLSALAGGALAITLFAPAAHAASPARLAQQVRPQGDHLNGDAWTRDHGEDGGDNGDSGGSDNSDGDRLVNLDELLELV
jgi:hypothetical protein